MAVPFPNSIIRVLLLVKPDAYVVLADGDGLAGIGFEGIGVSGENNADNLLLELGFLFSELRFVVVVVVVGEIGGIEEKVFEGLGEKGIVVVWGPDLESAHESLEEKIIEIRGVAEGAHGDRFEL